MLDSTAPNTLPIVSVFMPVYNRGDLVQASIRGLLNQTYPAIELLVLDDGSTDDSVAKVEAMRAECEQRFVSFKFLKNDHNCDLPAAMNRLSAIATGKYIMRNDSDDIAHPECVAKEVAFLEAHPGYVLAVGESEFIDGSGDRIGWTEQHRACPLESATYKTFGEFLQIRELGERFGSYEELITGNHIPGGYVVVAEAWKKALPFTEEAPLEDWYVMLQLAKLGKFAFLDEILYSYRWHTANTMKKVARIQYVGAKTFDYEEKLVREMKDKRWEQLLQRYGYHTKRIVSLAPVLEIYKTKSPASSRYFLKVFGKTFLIHYRDILRERIEALREAKNQA